MSTGAWGTSGWGNSPSELDGTWTAGKASYKGDAPWGHALSSTVAFTLKERYIRTWLASMPFELNRDFSTGFTKLLDIIESSDYEIGRAHV